MIKINETFVPPRNLIFLMLILNELKEVEGRIKLFKIHYLIEQEGHVKFDLPIEDQELGPVDFATFDFAKQNGFVKEEVFLKGPYKTYKITITRKGKEFFEKNCKSHILEDELKNAIRIIKKYHKKTSTQILKYIHKIYVDKFLRDKNKKLLISDSYNQVKMFIDIIKKEIEKGKEKSSYEILGQLYHMEKILEKLKKVRSASKIGSVLRTTHEYLNALEINKYEVNLFITELFEFLDNYCDKEGVCNSIYSENLDDIPEGDRERILNVLAQI